MPDALLQSDLPFPVRRGKVRDVYDLGDALLIVATDRISAFDCVMPNGIPDKGKILTALSLFWFEQFAGRVREPPDRDRRRRSTRRRVQPFADQLAGRSMLVKKATVVPIECVARGYLAGSGWKEYQQTQTVCGIELPPGLRQCDKLPEPIFTPATKEESGHDINISFEEAARRVGEQTRRRAARPHARRSTRRPPTTRATRGVIIADTKFEFGLLARRPADPDRRSPHARQQPLLARRPVRARARPAELRQAVRAQLAGDAAVGQDAPRARGCRRTWWRGRGGGTWRRTRG